jgi:hypothetical protein
MDLAQIQNLYLKICLGYSSFNFEHFGEVFVAHLRHLQSCKIRQSYDEGMDLAKKLGLKPEKDYLEYFIEKKWWSKEKEDEIKGLSNFIESLKKSKERVILPSQKEAFEKEIAETQINLSNIILERKSLIPFTAEEYAEKHYGKVFLLESLFKDSKLLEKAFQNQESLKDIDDEVYEKLWSNTMLSIAEFSVENIKYLSASSFFQNLLYLSGKDHSCYNFFGKPVVELTTYQIDVFSNGVYYRSFIENSTEKISSDILSDPKSLIDWIESNSSASSGAKKMLDKSPNSKKKARKGEERSGRMSSFVGATKSDYEKLGIQGLAGEDSGLFAAAKKQETGTIDIYQAVKSTEKYK